ncbi:DUF2975 domain-containing protein [Ruicaihuangia caeni]|uniref:DUF2975 domain-containing protein n=1 Tax=Ruicaihuangia caeni TaxID=3042517 RepID=UPI00338FFDEF
MTNLAIVLAKVFIAVLFVIAVAAQVVVVPIAAAEAAEAGDGIEWMHMPFLVLGILFVACAEVVLWCIWRLLSMVRRDAIFSARAFKFVDAIIVALLLAGALIATVLLVRRFTGNAGPPGLFLLAFGAGIACAALALVVFVLRGLLLKAADQAQYLTEVV